MFAILCTSYDFWLMIFSHVDFSKNLIFGREFNTGSSFVIILENQLKLDKLKKSQYV